MALLYLQSFQERTRLPGPHCSSDPPSVPLRRAWLLDHRATVRSSFVLASADRLGLSSLRPVNGLNTSGNVSRRVSLVVGCISRRTGTIRAWSQSLRHTGERPSVASLVFLLDRSLGDNVARRMSTFYTSTSCPGQVSIHRNTFVPKRSSVLQEERHKSRASCFFPCRDPPDDAGDAQHSRLSRAQSCSKLLVILPLIVSGVEHNGWSTNN